VTHGARPPRLARALLLRALPDDAREFVVGDLDEEFAARRNTGAPIRNAAWYWSQALRSVVHSRRQDSMMIPSPRPSIGRSLLAWLASFSVDVRIAIRALLHARGYSLAALLTLALGVGASIAVFSALNAVMLRPLSIADPGRLAMLWESNAARQWRQVHAAPANVLDWRARVRAFSAIGFLNDGPSSVSLGGGSAPGQVALAQVSGNLFDVLGVPALHGRTFREDETFESGRVVLSHRIWRQQFGSDPAVVGRTVRLDGRPYEVIGVMGPDFRYAITEADVWTTMPGMAARRGTVWFRRAHVVRAIGRLAPGATFAQAAAELEAVSLALEREYPDTNVGMRAGLTPLKTFLVGDDRRTTLLLLLGAVGLLQLIACTNVANLTLARGAARRQEMAVRAALGAGRGRLVRYLLTESLVLAALGTTLGVVLGAAGLQAIAGVSPPALDGLVFRADWRLVIFAVGLGLASAALAGTWPAWLASRGVLRHAAESTRTISASPRRLSTSNVLVAFEVALAIILLVSAGLMVRSLDQLRRVTLGVETKDVLTFQIHPASGTYGSAGARVDFADRFAARIAQLPGVTAVGIGRGLPLTGYGWTSDFTIDRWPPDRFGIDVRHREATAGYFTALGIPVLAGRLFEDSDLAADRHVPVVVNRAFAERYFPGESPVGRQIVFDRAPTERSYWYPIVGVVGNERRSLTQEPQPEIIAHLRGDTPSTLTYVVRTSGGPAEAIAGPLRSALADLDRETPLLAVRTMTQVAIDARAVERFVLMLLAVFAAAATVLAAIGVYGVASQAARARTREVGIRLALGASGPAIVRALVTRGAVVVGIGVAAGLSGALLSGGLLTSFLFRVDPRDPATLAIVTCVIAAVAMLAHGWPTWRATRIDPAAVLRSD
jgi:predicted permease